MKHAAVVILIALLISIHVAVATAAEEQHDAPRLYGVQEMKIPPARSISFGTLSGTAPLNKSLPRGEALDQARDKALERLKAEAKKKAATAIMGFSCQERVSMKGLDEVECSGLAYRF